MLRMKSLSIYFDLILCVILIPVMTLLLPVDRWMESRPLFVVFLLLWLYGVYFINRKLTMPLIFGRKQYLYAIILVLATFAVTYIITQSLAPHGAHFMRNPGPVPHYRFFPKMRPQEQGVWFLFMVVTMLSLAMGLMNELYIRTIQKKEVEQERNKAELALYKAQINPHFMFNTLNTIYGLMITKSDKAETAYMQFMDMLRYMYSNEDKEFIPVREEIKYLQQYVELQKNRLNGHTSLTFDVKDEGSDNDEIAPMLLITFLENAFKYGVSSHVDSSIYIGIGISEGKLTFKVSNDKIPGRNASAGDGIGLANCRKRLELLYHGRYVLNITETENRYSVDLTVKLHG